MPVWPSRYLGLSGWNAGFNRGFGHAVNLSDEQNSESGEQVTLQGQIVGLERRTSAVGRDTISHPDRGHDDVANAVAGAAALSKFGGYDTSMRWVSGDDDSGDAWQRVRLQTFINSGGASDYDGVLRAHSR